MTGGGRPAGQGGRARAGRNTCCMQKSSICSWTRVRLDRVPETAALRTTIRNPAPSPGQAHHHHRHHPTPPLHSLAVHVCAAARPTPIASDPPPVAKTWPNLTLAKPPQLLQGNPCQTPDPPLLEETLAKPPTHHSLRNLPCMSRVQPPDDRLTPRSLALHRKPWAVTTPATHHSLRNLSWMLAGTSYLMATCAILARFSSAMLVIIHCREGGRERGG